MKRHNKSPYETFAALSDAQKEAEYRRLDDPKIALRAKPMDARMQTLWKQARRKVGRPKVGRGATRVLISVERGLLEDADKFARRHRITRSQLFCQGIRATLAKAG